MQLSHRDCGQRFISSAATANHPAQQSAHAGMASCHEEPSVAWPVCCCGWLCSLSLKQCNQLGGCRSSRITEIHMLNPRHSDVEIPRITIFDQHRYDSVRPV